MHTLAQILTLLITIGLNKSQKFDFYGRPKCCGGSLSPSYNQAKPWEDTLREAAYQSIIHHFDYPGTLDGRLDRDQKLWKHLQEARFTLKNNYLFGDTEEDTKSGILLMKRLSDQSFLFEFQQRDRPHVDCLLNECDMKNSSLLVSWKVHKKGNDDRMKIQIKLPIVNKKRALDVYEYNIQSGLKKMDPNPIQHNSFSPHRTYKEHRFANIPRTKSGFRSVDHYKGGFSAFDENTRIRFQNSERVKSRFGNSERMDFPFKNTGNENFGTGRIIPTSFMYETPFYSSEERDEGWTRFQSPRKPYHLFLEDTGLRNDNEGSLFGSSGSYGSKLPEGYHPLQQQTLPQEIEGPGQDSRGFLPSIGPISVPPSYRNNYAYDPRYRLSYGSNQPMMTPSTFTTTSYKHFKPSTEYVRYSELDPFYHSDDKRDLLLTTLRTNVVFDSPQTSVFSLPMTEKSTTDNPIEKTTLFQIIVDNMKSNNSETTTDPIAITPHTPVTNSSKNSVSQTTPSTRTTTNDLPHKKTVSQVNTKAKEKSSFNDKNFDSGRAFGEKIIPKTRTTTKPKTIVDKIKPTPKHKTILDFSTRAEPFDTEVNERKTTTLRTPEKFTMPLLLSQKENHHSSKKVKEEKDFGIGSTISLDRFTENVHDYKTTENIDITTHSYFETTTELNPKVDSATVINTKGTTFDSDFLTTTTPWDYTNRTIIPEITDFRITSLNFTEPDIITNTPDIGATKTDITTMDTTELTTQVGTIPDSYTSPEKDFYTSMTNLFMMETTTNKKDDEGEKTSTAKAVGDAETQESKQHKTHYRLLTFPGDPVSIVANRISKTISYRTAAGKERKLPSKLPFSSRYKFSDLSNDYRTISK